MTIRSRVRAQAVVLAAAAALLLAAGCSRSDAAPGKYNGTLTFNRGDVVGPQAIIDLDLATDQVVSRFDGWDAQRAPGGETAYITRVVAGHFGDAAVVVADARGVPGPPLFDCKTFNYSSNRVCHTPKLSPDRKLVAFGTVGGDGKLCKSDYDMFWADFVIVRDRKGADVARFEGFFLPEWLPDGRLLMMGSKCRGAGVWVADRSLGGPVRIDGGDVATPGGVPAVSPDGKRLALVWNNQLWTMTLDGKHELAQVTRFENSASAAAWSPDGRALAVLLWDVSLPVKAVVLLRPGDASSQVVKPLAFYPYGPLSWR